MNKTEIPLKINQRVRREESIIVDEQAAKTRELSLVGSTADSLEERHHDRGDRPERVADTGAETCKQNWRGR